MIFTVRVLLDKYFTNAVVIFMMCAFEGVCRRATNKVTMAPRGLPRGWSRRARRVRLVWALGHVEVEEMRSRMNYRRA